MENPFIPVDFDPFAEPNILKFVDTTEAQREIWTSVKIGGDSANCAYNESVSLRLMGNLNLPALTKAVNKVIERHDALRSVFLQDGIKMIVNPLLSVKIQVVDFTKNTNKKAAEKQWLEKEVSIPFSLEDGPLIRFSLIHSDATEHVFVITAHHIICDGWSISIIMQDIGNFYSSVVSGKTYVKNPAIQFSDYAVSEKQKLHGEEYEAIEKFWLEKFRSVSETLELPVDRQRPPLRTFNAHRIDVEFNMDVIDKIKQIGAKAGCSFVNTLTVAFEVYLYRITSCKDIVLGIPAAGQSVTGHYDLVGHCVNLLPLKSSMVDGIGFIDHLKKRKSEILDAFDNQQYTFGSLISKLNLPRDPGRIPLVPVIFNVDAGVFDGVKFEGLEIAFYSNPRTFENFEIFINAANYNGRFIVECTFNTDLFDEDIMGIRMAGFNEILASIVEEPTTTIDKLNILTKGEKKRILVDWNQTSVSYPENKSIHQLFNDTATIYPNDIAIIAYGESITFRQLYEKSNILANHLINIGVQTNSIVALCTDRSADMVVGLLAILKAGATYLPIDPAFPRERIQDMLYHAKVELMITQQKHLEELDLIINNTFLFENNWVEKTTKNTSSPDIEINKDHRAYVLYTSGSTGRPKGVQVSHKNVVNLLSFFKNELDVGPKDNLLAVTTISFDIAGLELFLPLISGAKLTLVTKDEMTDPGKLIDKIQTEGISIMQATPATWNMLLTAGWNGNAALKLLCGGEALAADLAKKLISCCNSLWNVYGPTETTIWSTVYRVGPNETILTPYASIGKPLANTQIYVLDKNQEPVPVGVAGELFIGGDGVSLGYLSRPLLNDEMFVPDKFAKDNDRKLYRTGDLVRFKRDGNIDFINRMDNQVKIRGYRIELGEIEAALTKYAPLKENVVIARKDESGDNRIIAYYTRYTNQKITTEQLRTHLRQTLPDYMIPGFFIELKEFPQTPNNKIDRKALPEPNIQFNGSENFIEARTANENLLASIWSEILGIERVSMTDDFFRLGGHSLLAVRLMMEIEKHRNIKLPLAILFTNSTIEKLARFMDTELNTQIWQSIVPIKTQGNKAPLYFAHGVSGNVFKYHALANLLPADQPCYGLQAFGLNGKDVPFENLEEMAAYHIKEILKFQPDGKPFSLAGGSFGGYLAYEMAIQLEKMGHKVDLVALFDIDAATVVEFLPAHWRYIKRTEIMAKRIVNRTVNFLKADSEERDRYLTSKLKSLTGKNDLDTWLDKDEVKQSVGVEGAEYFNKIENACYKALMNYKIKKYGKSVVLFRAKSGYFSAKYDYDLGWKHYAKGGVQVFEVPGDHNSIFNKGNVEEMAVIFTGCLKKVQSK